MTEKRPLVKCVVWDLDNTLWHGVLLESDCVRLKPEIPEILKTLDARGILHSIASKNNRDDAMRKLEEFGIADYFLYPEINWNAKSVSIQQIQQHLNIGIETILFLDDEAYEREEVKSVHKDVTCWDASEMTTLLAHPRLNPPHVTEDAKRRRLMYCEEIQRKAEEQEFKGPTAEFLASLKMEFIISEAQEDDLRRAEELTVRTHQLNATGRAYSYAELKQFCVSDVYELFVCELTDRFGSYGKIGLALVQIEQECWHLKLLLVSCRVISRGIGTILLSFIMQQAKTASKILLADFTKTKQNAMLLITYQFANFQERSSDDKGNLLLENDLSRIQPFPLYVDVIYTPHDLAQNTTTN
jgi:FkbH-like protein